MAQNLINTPPIRSPVDEEDAAGVMREWATWFTQVFQACFAVYQAGTTSERPTENLWTGRVYFDTTLTKPVWYTGTGSVWVDASGTPV